MARSLGLDFGTTNTVAARVAADGRAQPSMFTHGNEQFSAFRSLLCFWQDVHQGRAETLVDAGPWAIEHLIDEPGDCRFLQSFKTFAANAGFRHTTIYGQNYQFEDLLAAFFEKFRAHAGPQAAQWPRRLVLGRPVTFAGPNPDAALARQRYDAAFERFGFEEIHHVHEPVAAAYFFAQRLASAATVLVADFGGGTSDFSVVRFEAGGRRMKAKALASTGVGIAGDTFDYRIIDHVVSPLLGKGTSYKSWGKVLSIPGHYYSNFARWNQLSMMKYSGVLAELRHIAKHSLAKQQLEIFVDFLEADAGYPLYRAVSGVKTRLSSTDHARLVFQGHGLNVDATVKRADFEAWIADDLARIGRSVDACLQRAECGVKGIDRVFLTGGSSFVPAVRRLFEKKFGAAKIETGDQLLSIANGLALIGEDPDIEHWTVAPGSDAPAVDDESDE